MKKLIKNMKRMTNILLVTINWITHLTIQTNMEINTNLNS